MGLVEQLTDVTSHISKMAGPLRPLLKAKNAFFWDSVDDKAFEETKKALVSLPVLTNFQPGRPLFLHTDASWSKELGFALLQEDIDGNKRLLQAGSRFITETEARYTMIELELLPYITVYFTSTYHYFITTKQGCECVFIFRGLCGLSSQAAIALSLIHI